MNRVTRRGARRRTGFTLAELLVSLALLAVVLSIAAAAATTQWRSDAGLDARRAAHAQLQAGAHALASVLRTAAGDAAGADSSDLVVVTDTLLELRAAIGASVVCAVVDAYTLDLPPLSIDAPLLTWWSAIPIPGDALLVDSAAGLPAGVADGWVSGSIAAFGQSAHGCAGTPYVRASEAAASRPRVRMATPLPALAPGAVVRFARRVRWVHYRGSDGRWYLGQREWNGGAWTTTQPVAGPLRAPGARGGVSLRARDAAGALVTSGTMALVHVATVDVTLRADVPGLVRRAPAAVDSVAVRVALRNGTAP